MQVLSWHIVQLGASYVVVGFGIGIMQQAVLLEEAEVAPTHLRGLFTCLQNVGFQAGACTWAECADAGRAAWPPGATVRWHVLTSSMLHATGYAIMGGLFRYKPLTDLVYGWRLLFTGDSCCCCCWECWCGRT